MLPTNAKGHWLARADFSLYNPPLPWLCCSCREPQTLGGAGPRGLLRVEPTQS